MRLRALFRCSAHLASIPLRIVSRLHPSIRRSLSCSILLPLTFDLRAWKLPRWSLRPSTTAREEIALAAPRSREPRTLPRSARESLDAQSWAVSSRSSVVKHFVREGVCRQCALLVRRGFLVLPAMVCGDVVAMSPGDDETWTWCRDLSTRRPRAGGDPATSAVGSARYEISRQPHPSMRRHWVPACAGTTDSIFPSGYHVTADDGCSPLRPIRTVVRLCRDDDNKVRCASLNPGSGSALARRKPRAPGVRCPSDETSSIGGR